MQNKKNVNVSSRGWCVDLRVPMKITTLPSVKHPLTPPPLPPTTNILVPPADALPPPKNILLPPADAHPFYFIRAIKNFTLYQEEFQGEYAGNKTHCVANA